MKYTTKWNTQLENSNNQTINNTWTFYLLVERMDDITTTAQRGHDVPHSAVTPALSELRSSLGRHRPPPLCGIFFFFFNQITPHTARGPWQVVAMTTISRKVTVCRYTGFLGILHPRDDILKHWRFCSLKHLGFLSVFCVLFYSVLFSVAVLLEILRAFTEVKRLCVRDT